MSHFSVLVIGANPEAQLAPYQENNMDDCPVQYLKFVDVEDEYRKEYDTEGTEMVRCEDGTLAYRWDERFRVVGTFGTSGDSHKVPAHLKEEHIPHKDRYATFEEFCTDWHGSKGPDPKTGRYGYWENPNAKWDYHRLGGRWAGFLRVKAGRQAIAGPNFGWEFDDRWDSKPGQNQDIRNARAANADQILKGDVDFEAMREEAAVKAAESYDLAMGFIGHLPPNRTWEEIRAESGDKHDKARDAYWSQPRCAAWKAAEKQVGYSDWSFGWDGSPDDFLISRDQYIENARNGAVTTFAVIKDGKWCERGSMGWFGWVSDEKDRETWHSQFWNMVKDLPDDCLLSVFDCHI